MQFLVNSNTVAVPWRGSQSVTPSYVVDESGHQLDVENSFVRITAALPCEGGIITVAFGDTIKLMAPLVRMTR